MIEVSGGTTMGGVSQWMLGWCSGYFPGADSALARFWVWSASHMRIVLVGFVIKIFQAIANAYFIVAVALSFLSYNRLASRIA